MGGEGVGCMENIGVVASFDGRDGRGSGRRRRRFVSYGGEKSNGILHAWRSDWL